LGTIISIILLFTGIGVLFFIARSLDPERKKRLTGILLVLLCILFFISQISFLLYPKERYKNWAGIFGYYSSYGLSWLCGFYCFIIPALFGYLGYINLSKTSKKNNLYLLLLIPIGIIIDTLLSLFLEYKGLINGSGGIIGMVISEFLNNYFGKVGSYIILAFSVVIILSIIFRKDIFHKPKVIESIKTEKKKKVIKKEIPDDKTEKEVKEQQPPAKIDYKTEFLNILKAPTKKYGIDNEALKAEAEIITRRLEEFDVKGKIVGIESGPVISRFEFEPAPGIKINRIANLERDLALALKATRIRILAPIPGKSAVGIEVPNKERFLVFLKSGLQDPDFENSLSPLAISLGEDITGRPVSDDISTMPHMLIAGTTGSGKSVFINNIIVSLLYHSNHQQVRFYMIDPKRLELPMYNPIPHLVRRTITEPKEAVSELEQLVSIMEMRYRDFAREGVRDIDGYNEKQRKKSGEFKPYIVVIVDELADLMLTAPTEIEENITRLAQMSRAVGIHLILATQRPSVDVITGLIKANFPCRVAFQVASKTDSRTILDMNGAESLLGRGDMLFLPPGKGTPVRLHGAYISTDEVRGISNLLTHQYLTKLFRDIEGNIDEIISAIIDEELWTVFIDPRDPAFDEKFHALTNILPEEKITEIIKSGYYPALTDIPTEEIAQEKEQEQTEVDLMFNEAARLVFRHQNASVSLLQRRLNIGYARAGRIIDQLETAGIVEPFQGSKSRKVLIEKQEDLDEILLRYR